MEGSQDINGLANEGAFTVRGGGLINRGVAIFMGGENSGRLSRKLDEELLSLSLSLLPRL